MTFSLSNAIFHSRAFIAAGLALAAMAAAAAALTPRPPPHSPMADDGSSSSSLPSRKGAIHGTVIVKGPAPGAATARRYHIPGHVLVLRDAGTSAPVAEFTTDVAGRYYFPPQDIGSYTLTWAAQAGWAAGTYPHPIVIDQGMVSNDQIELTPGHGGTVVIGTVLLADGNAAGAVDEFFGLDVTPSVWITTGFGVTIGGPVRTDASGAFALASDLQGGHLSLRASIEGISTQVAIFGASGFIQRDLTLPNSRPSIVSLFLKNAIGKGVRGAMGGDILRTEETINDVDGDPTSLQWKAGYTSASATMTQAGNTAEWTLPDVAGTQKLFVMVSDGRGGYVRGSVSSTINRRREIFSGIATDRTTGEPIRGVSVEVNRRFTETNSEGYYAIEVPFADTYLVNLRHRDYALAGKTLDAGVVGRAWRMVPRQAQVFDPRQPFTISDDRKGQGDGGRRGATLSIPANTLVDPNGRPPTGMLRASFATIDIANDESVGNYMGLMEDRQVGLISYGVLSIEVLDEAGTEYQIRPGGRARLSMPIPGATLGQGLDEAPMEAPVWSYDESDGFWKITGNAQLNRQTASYEGTVNHFSEINVDIPSSSSCIRVLLDPALISKTIRVRDALGGVLPDYPQVVEGNLDQAVNLLFAIPPDEEIILEILDAPGGSPLPNVIMERFDSTNPTAGWERLDSNIVLAGGVATPVHPAYPFTSAPITVLFKLEQAPADRFFVYKQSGSEAAAEAYYSQVNPPDGLGDGNRDTLELWWAHNGFDTDGSVLPTGSEAYARTSYMNNNDLGSGRDMHLYRREDGTTAAWVSNYGLFNQDYENANLALNQTNPGATVCMEFSPMELADGTFIDSAGDAFVEGDFGSTAEYLAAVEAESVTKFFVFQDVIAGDGSELQIEADLDGYGPRYVPNLCLNCHGGSANSSLNYDVPSECNVGAYFRELDYESYRFPAFEETPTDAVKAAFKVQNEIVHGADTSLISNAPIKELIEIWYDDGDPGDIEQDDCIPLDDDSIPAGWRDEPDQGELFPQFYCEVIAESCRTCHIAFDGFSFDRWERFREQTKVFDPPIVFTFDSRENQFRNYIDSTPSSYVMPHALVTYRNFWLSDSPHRPTTALEFFDENDG